MLTEGKGFVEKGPVLGSSMENIHDLVWDGNIFHQWEPIGS
jgi:hypothetical protein